MAQPTKTIYGVGTAVVVAVLTSVVAQVFLRNASVHSVFGVGPKIVNASGRIERVPHTQDFNPSSLDHDGISLSPDGQWLVYATAESMGDGPMQLVFLRLKDQQRFTVTRANVLNAAAQLPGIYPPSLADGTYFAATGGIADFGLLAPWTPDSRTFIFNVESSVLVDLNGRYEVRYPVVKITPDHTPTVAFLTSEPSGSSNDEVRRQLELTCADCDLRQDAAQRYAAIEGQLPADLRGRVSYDAGGDPYFSNFSVQAMGTKGTFYFPQEVGRGAQLMAWDPTTQAMTALVSLELPGSSELKWSTSITAINLSSNERKIALTVSASHAGFGGYSAGYILDRSTPRPTLYALGKGVFYNQYWNHRSDTVYFNCPKGTAEQSPGEAADRLCQLRLHP